MSIAPHLLNALHDHGMDGRLVVWVDSWQQECCGDPWSVGTVVSWTLTDADLESLAPLFASESEVRVDYREEHHGGLPEHAPITSGPVVGIRGVQVRYAPLAGGDPRMLYAVPQSARFTPLTHSEGPEVPWEGFTGYLVEIDTDLPSGRRAQT